MEMPPRGALSRLHAELGPDDHLGPRTRFKFSDCSLMYH